MNDLKEKGLKRLERELDFYNGTVEFLGVVENLSNHPKIASISNISENAIKTGMGNAIFTLYSAHLKEITEKDELDEILKMVSSGQSYHINDVGVQIGTTPPYIAVYGPCKIQFFQPREQSGSD